MFTNTILVAAVLLAGYLFARTSYVSIFTPRLTGSNFTSRSSVDILVPVRNEIASGLESNLVALAEQSHAATRLIVTDDRSTDGSRDVILRIARRYPGRVYNVDGVETPPGWMGKTYALAQAKSESTAEWIALVDADVSAGRDLLASTLMYAENNQLDAVSVLPAFEYRSFWVGIVLPIMVWLSGMRVSPTQTNRRKSKRAFGLGHFILVRRSAHDAIGGFEAYKDSVLDDCEVMVRLKTHGDAVAVIDGARHLSSPMYTSLPELWSGFAKNSFAAMNYSWIKLIAFLACESLLLIYAPLALVRGSGPAGISLLIFVGTMAVAGLRLKAPIQHYFFFPLGHLISAGIILSSAILTGIGKGVSWKGRLVK